MFLTESSRPTMDTRKSSHVFFYFLLGFGLSITALNSVHKKLENRVFTYQDVLERSRPGRLLDTLIRRSRGQSKQSTEETKPVHSRDDHELLRGALKRMSSPQNITDMCNQIFKDLEKDKRQSTRPSSKATDPRNCSKQEQIIQELKREPSNKVSK
ncbi:hypothetical protein Bca101_075063 [Brassica carinata]